MLLLLLACAPGQPPPKADDSAVDGTPAGSDTGETASSDSGATDSDATDSDAATVDSTVGTCDGTETEDACQTTTWELYASTADPTVEMSWTWDAAGVLRLYVYASESAGRTTLTYDASGLLIRDQVDQDYGDHDYFYTYDADGRVLEETGSWYSHGGPSATFVRYWTYSPDGLLSSVELDDTYIGHDIVSFAYDGAGNLLLELSDDNMDGTIDRTVAYTYDADNRPILTEADDDGDGLPETRSSSTWDPGGHLLFQEVDRFLDGELFSHAEYVYGTTGLLLSSDERTSSGSILLHAYTYDRSGNLLTHEADQRTGPHEDGTYDSLDVSLYTYTYDASNHELTAQRYDLDAGTLSSSYVYTYDDHGNPSTLVGFGGDFTVDWRCLNVYDAQDRLLSATVVDETGAQVKAETWTWLDCCGG